MLLDPAANTTDTPFPSPQKSNAAADYPIAAERLHPHGWIEYPPDCNCPGQKKITLSNVCYA